MAFLFIQSIWSFYTPIIYFVAHVSTLPLISLLYCSFFKFYYSTDHLITTPLYLARGAQNLVFLAWFFHKKHPLLCKNISGFCPRTYKKNFGTAKINELWTPVLSNESSQQQNLLWWFSISSALCYRYDKCFSECLEINLKDSIQKTAS